MNRRNDPGKCQTLVSRKVSRGILGRGTERAAR